ncbi:MAG: biotin--[acetyl-CoA-carboxylase] ligase [Acidobacteriota bacterium]
MSPPATLDLGRLRDGLGSTRFADRAWVFPEVDSTIDRVRALIAEGSEPPLVVIADAQRKGRGQRGRAWHSPPGLALYVSALVRPRWEPSRALALTAVTGLAAVAALQSFDVDCRLKRPNDLLVQGPFGLRKLAGVLVETAIQGDLLRHAVLSLGLNVSQTEDDFPERIREHVVSLVGHGVDPPPREDLAVAFLVELDRGLAELDTADGAEAVLRRHRELSEELPEFRVPDLQLEASET